jgi:tRNA U34 2-thiouridine synthase MnmA/TrmU
MREAGAKHFATGHYAKLFHNETHQSVFVHTSSDEQFDQSSLLSRLPHEILASMMLPLSDLTRKEVLKLAENFGETEWKKKIEMHECLTKTKELTELLVKKIPKKFIAEGEITNLDGTMNYGNHEGVYQFTLGDPIEIKDLGRQFKGVFSEYSFPDKKLKVSDPGHFMRDKFMLVNCHLSEEVSWLEPIKGYVILPDNVYMECWMFPKTLSTVSIQLTEKNKVIPGNVVSVVKKKGKNSKVFLTGEVQLLAEDLPEPEGVQRVAKVDPILDF